MQNKITIQYYDHPPTQRRYIEIDDRNWEFLRDVIKRGCKTHGVFTVTFEEIK